MISTAARVQTQDRNINQLQSNILTQLNAIVKNPLINGNILTEQALLTGSNTLNHGLNRTIQGWFIVRLRSSASIFDTQDSNPTPNLTLLLTSSANVVADVFVF